MKRQYVASGKSVQVDVVATPSGARSIRVDDAVLDVEVLRQSSNGRTSCLVLRVGNTVREVLVHQHEDEFEVASRSARGFVALASSESTAGTAGARTTSKDVRAPMPGRVVRIFAKVGEQVRRGQPLLVVEAMKMENEIKAPADGVVAAIRVAEGDSVETRAVLLVFE